MDGIPLNPRTDLYNHSPDGFAWGYSGSGPAQLALAIVADFLGDDEEAQKIYQKFRFEVISNITQDHPWVLTGEQIASTETLKLVAVAKVMES